MFHCHFIDFFDVRSQNHENFITLHDRMKISNKKIMKISSCISFLFTIEHELLIFKSEAAKNISILCVHCSLHFYMAFGDSEFGDREFSLFTYLIRTFLNSTRPECCDL